MPIQHKGRISWLDSSKVGFTENIWRIRAHFCVAKMKSDKLFSSFLRIQLNFDEAYLFS